MTAIALIITLALGLLLVPRVTDAQPPKRIPRLGVLSSGFGLSDAELQRLPFWQEMHGRGWVEGQTITVARRQAEGHDDRLPSLAAELVQLKVDVILAGGPRAARAAKAASDTIPIVFMAAGDPVRMGLATSLAQPDRNMTGVSAVSPELSAKRLELLKAAAAGISRVAVLTNAGVNYLLPEMTHAAQSLGVTLYPLDVPASDQLDEAFAAMMTARAEALLVLPEPLFSREVHHVVELAATSRLPTIYPFRHFVDAGGLMSYGPNSEAILRRAAYYVDRILKGAQPADLPIEQPTKYELVINLKTANALGLTIPPNLLFQADEVIR